jgi:thiamine-phosphate pyrophosphorylase
LSDGRPVSFRIYLITDRKVLRSGDLIEVCDNVLRAANEVAPGIAALQLREKDLAGRELYELACRLRDVTARTATPFLINDRVDIAMACGADGVHLPFASIGAGAARRLLGEDKLIGVSTHSEADLVTESRAGHADFAVFGPVYEPLSKAAYGTVHGEYGFFRASRASSIPVFALGGINAARAAALVASPERDYVAGIATIGAIVGSESPAAAMREMIGALAGTSAPL